MLNYFMIGVCIVFVVAAIIKIAIPDKSSGKFGFGTDDFDVVSFSQKQAPFFTYSADSIVRYQRPENKCMVQVKMNSGMGFYVLAAQFFSLILAVVILWFFRKIFKEMDIGKPFNYSVIKRLRSLALFFVIIDVLKLINYFIFNFLLSAHLPDQRFALVSGIGNNIVIGAVIWLISIIFQRGFDIQQDQDLPFNFHAMKKVSIVFLQSVLVLIGVVALVMLIRFPLTEGRAANLGLFSIYADPFILYGYAASILFFVALYKAFRLLGYIRQNKVFSSDSVGALKSIKYCAIVLSILIAMAGLYIKIFHDKEDDPAGFLAICMITIFVSITVATAAAIFQKILQNAIDMKSENDLTI